MARLYMIAAGISLAGALVAWIWFTAQEAERAKAAEDYRDATETDRDEQDRLPDDPDGILEWLRSYAE